MLCVSVASRILAATGAFRCSSKPSRAGTPALVAAAAACEALAVIAMVHRRVAGVSGCQSSLALSSCTCWPVERSLRACYVNHLLCSCLQAEVESWPHRVIASLFRKHSR